MGYTTWFDGEVKVDPPLNADEISYLRDFASSRRVRRERGPYFVLDHRSGRIGPVPDDREGHRDDVINNNAPPADQPGLWCHWVPTDDGAHIEWDGGEKFYESERWMKYLIDHFLAPGCMVSTLDGRATVDERLASFTFDHVVNGTIDADGEDWDDNWQLVVVDNVVSVAYGEITYGDPQAV